MHIKGQIEANRSYYNHLACLNNIIKHIFQHILWFKNVYSANSFYAESEIRHQSSITSDRFYYKGFLRKSYLINKHAYMRINLLLRGFS